MECVTAIDVLRLAKLITAEQVLTKQEPINLLTTLLLSEGDYSSFASESGEWV